MSTILRLEGLDVKAGTEDIRTFFQSLDIPDGGVYIMGGHLGEAFISFTTVSDAQAALLRSGNLLKGSMVTLHISSMEEIEWKLEESLNSKKTSLTVRKPHPRSAENEMSRRHKDKNGDVKSKSSSHDVYMAKVKPKSGPRDINILKPKSRLHEDNMTTMKQKSRPHANMTMKPKSRLHDVNKIKVKPKSRLHGDSTSISSSAAFPLDPDPADLPASNAQHFQLSPTNMPASNAQPLDADSFLLGVCTVLKRLQSTQTMVPMFEFPHVDSTTSSEAVRNPEHTLDLRPGYARLFGLPASVTKEDICKFFKGLRVEDVIVNVELGISRGCLVKFADMQNASDALGFNQQLLGSVHVEVRGADEKLWLRALQECSKAFDDRSKWKHERSPTEKAHYERRSVTSLKRTSDQVQFKPLKNPKLDAEPNASSRPSEYTVMVRNLPKNMTKTDIKELFRCPNLPHKNVLHLLDETSNITDTAFLSFNCTEDFDYAINLSGCHGGSGAIEVKSISKELMWKIIAKNHPRNQRTDPRLQRSFRKSEPVQEPVQTDAPQRESLNETGQRYIFIRNMPATVKKSQIRSLFCKFSLSLDDIILIHDSEGYGSGEAVVKFESEQQVTQAQRLHGEEFLGSKVILTPINEKQMKKILMNT
ncbi:RNA binding motif protein 12Ba [Poecilia formosa]|uniref:RNA binding motif protein 12Ba n=1 Tax=Poecilia formosa TaxID=48698 RepID=UPI00044398D9|nr:PREDICTED: RNA-binding protein 12B [Poecilia formosa]XP_007556274.1 PREDICTED: RNA-binding protein 12B [Poecilia formosa]XP_007556275.1 PREDICTED: RNA-binding protein 12B [Poecilia formosa]XP_016528950.1 PREDICTED: RNA-binding protein 12B [Poecilia formosa]